MRKGDSPDGTQAVKCALVFINPAAGGGGRQAEAEEALRTPFTAHGWRLHVHVIAGGSTPESLVSVLHDAVRQGCEQVIAAGGDGTVSLVAAVMMRARVDTASLPLGIFPAGTANVLHKETGSPAVWADAATFLATTTSTIPLDVMAIRDDFFILRVGVGLDAQTIRDTTKEEKRTWGSLAYVKNLLGRLRTSNRHHFTCRLDGRRIKLTAVQVFVANGGGLNLAPFRIGPGIRFDDGILNLCAYDAFGWLDYFKVAWKLFRRHYKREPLLRFYPIRREVTVGTRRPLPVQADGEPSGHTPVTIRLIPGALRLVALPTPEEDHA
jgi:diacylglycerol kinase family enzyme